LNQPQQHSSSIIAGHQSEFGCGLDSRYNPIHPNGG
jgi:hypothetical protein